MDVTKQVKKFVEKKIEQLIREDLKILISEENSRFDINSYVSEVLDKYFTQTEVDNIKNEILKVSSRDEANHYESDYSSEADTYSQESFELDAHEFHTLSPEEIINNLQSNSYEIQIKYLKELEMCADDLANYTTCNVIKKILQNILQSKGNREIHISALKVFQKFLFCHGKPQLVSDSFVSLTELVSFHIELINSENLQISLEEIFDLKENKWLSKKITPETKESLEKFSKERQSVDPEVLIKSMFLLIKCQYQIPDKWIRFNEKRLREIVFAFIHLLSSTTTSECRKITGLELLSILNPTANWSRHWCHTAIGRSLLCSALRKYKSFFVHIVEIILINTRKRKISLQRHLTNDASTKEAAATGGTPRQFTSTALAKAEMNKENIGINDWSACDERRKCVRSAPTAPAKKYSLLRIKMKNEKNSKSDYLIENISRETAARALLCHNMSLVVSLIQFRSGRSLFPLQVHTKKRLLSVQDLVSSMTYFLENVECCRDDGNDAELTQAYRQHIWKITEILKSIQSTVSSNDKLYHR